ncbi:hypothetical protein LOTGIDRAFT_203165 [Lottia gigantea]|uniref:Phosphatidylinositol-glycan biosynthesis class X protein n=1 Tax=Lottia gigantea TaxID=225164 RepID=V3ZDE4_LOTGI|nr:hypothetical protein LOTGIDRAFT_203165 [Lottia gigantea]ESO89133.1 hypothetical protein LOTGIDRAFT_203165 [Lottia gigantea]
MKIYPELDIIVKVIALFFISNVETFSQVSRDILKDGFHRDLETEILLSTEDDQVLETDCKIVIIETLPSGVYVDNYQINTINTSYQFLLEEEVDIEAPEYLSLPLSVYIYHNKSSTINISLPIHIRYHRPSNTSQYKQIIIQSPVIYTTCYNLIAEETGNIKLPCDNTKANNCTWKKLNHNKIEDITILVPVGSSDDSLIVTVITLLVTVGGCVFIMLKVMTTDTNTSSGKHKRT